LILVFMAYQRLGARVMASEFEWQTVGDNLAGSQPAQRGTKDQAQARRADAPQKVHEGRFALQIRAAAASPSQSVTCSNW